MREIIIRKTIKTITIIVGVIILLIGIVLIPYPGPGWLIVFAGLAILAGEISVARNLLNCLHEKYERWQKWLKQQNLFIRSCFWVATGVLVILTAWLLNTFGFIDKILDLNLDWLVSPFFR